MNVQEQAAPPVEQVDPSSRPDDGPATDELPVVAQEPLPALPAPGHPPNRPYRLLGVPALATALSEVAAGIVLAQGGQWPAGKHPWLFLLCAGLIWGSFWPRPALALSGDKGGERFQRGLRVLGVALAMAVGIRIAFSMAPWAGVWVAALAATALASHSPRVPALLATTLFALGRSGTFGLGLMVVMGGPGQWPAAGLLVLAGLYGVLAFTTSCLARLADKEEPTPSRIPIDLLAVGSWALVAVPFVWMIPTSHIIARGISLVMIACGVFGVLRLARRKRSWDQNAAAAAAAACQHSLTLFAAAAVLLPWTYTAVTVCTSILVGTHLVRRWSGLKLSGEDWSRSELESPATLNQGLAHLERALKPAEGPTAESLAEQGLSSESGEESDPSELAKTQNELEEVRAQLAQALLAGANDAARNDMLERRIQKLLQAVRATEDELQRVSRIQAMDPGRSSLYREVQGLSAEDEMFSAKSEMLGAIFEANLEFRRQLDEASTGAAAE